MNIDIHAHIIVPEILRQANPADTWRPRVFRDEQGRQQIDHAGKVVGTTPRGFVHIEGILAEQPAAAVDIVALSPWTSLLNWNLPPEESQRSCRVQNDSIARIAHDHSRQVAGMGIVPLQDPGLAAKEAEYIVRELGLHAIEVGTNVNGTYLGDETLLPFWETVAAFDTFVFVHPVAGIGGPLMQQYELWNLFGNPSETGLTTASLIFGGVLERFPLLKICMAHGGGVLPYIIGRFDRGFQVRPATQQAKITRPPGTYFKQLYFDTITHSVDALRYLIQVVGADHILLGSDYPFDMGSDRPRDLVNQLNLPSDQTQAILGATAARLLKIKV